MPFEISGAEPDALTVTSIFQPRLLLRGRNRSQRGEGHCRRNDKAKLHLSSPLAPGKKPGESYRVSEPVTTIQGIDPLLNTGGLLMIGSVGNSEGSVSG